MEKHGFLWSLANQFLRRLILVINVSFLITLVGFSDVFAMPDNPSAGAVSNSELQQLTVTGKISDASTGEALAGVNIVVEGTTIGAISGANGEYSISTVPGNGNLRFSFIGYVTQSIAVRGRTVINVQLHPETTGLGEVVVVGNGTSKKETLTGSVSSIKSDQLISTKSLSVASAIQGKIPGVQVRQQTGEPGTFNSRVSVRGFGEPLLVIDGVVRDGMSDFERMNPEDIENISVLKDAAASIYGLGTANGVFIVTTKRGL